MLFIYLFIYFYFYLESEKKKKRSSSSLLITETAVTKPRSDSKIVIDKNHKPIEVYDFSDRWEKLKRDSYNGLSEEYKVTYFIMELYLLK